MLQRGRRNEVWDRKVRYVANEERQDRKEHNGHVIELQDVGLLSNYKKIKVAISWNISGR